MYHIDHSLKLQLIDCYMNILIKTIKFIFLDTKQQVTFF